MSKTNRKIFIGIFILLLTMFFVSCGGGKKESNFSDKQVEQNLTEYFEKLPEEIIEIELTEELKQEFVEEFKKANPQDNVEIAIFTNDFFQKKGGNGFVSSLGGFYLGVSLTSNKFTFEKYQIGINEINAFIEGIKANSSFPDRIEKLEKVIERTLNELKNANISSQNKLQQKTSKETSCNTNDKNEARSAIAEGYEEQAEAIETVKKNIGNFIEKTRSFLTTAPPNGYTWQNECSFDISTLDSPNPSICEGFYDSINPQLATSLEEITSSIIYDEISRGSGVDDFAEFMCWCSFCPNSCKQVELPICVANTYGIAQISFETAEPILERDEITASFSDCEEITKLYFDESFSISLVPFILENKYYESNKGDPSSRSLVYAINKYHGSSNTTEMDGRTCQILSIENLQHKRSLIGPTIFSQISTIAKGENLIIGGNGFIQGDNFVYSFALSDTPSLYEVIAEAQLVKNGNDIVQYGTTALPIKTQELEGIIKENNQTGKGFFAVVDQTRKISSNIIELEITTIINDCGNKGGDSDNDEVCEDKDNCLSVINTDQTNTDGDEFGDVCDNCPNVSNNDQKDIDGDKIGDACETSNNPPKINDDIYNVYPREAHAKWGGTKTFTLTSGASDPEDDNFTCQWYSNDAILEGKLSKPCDPINVQLGHNGQEEAHHRIKVKVTDEYGASATSNEIEVVVTATRPLEILDGSINYDHGIPESTYFIWTMHALGGSGAITASFLLTNPEINTTEEKFMDYVKNSNPPKFTYGSTLLYEGTYTCRFKAVADMDGVNTTVYYPTIDKPALTINVSFKCIDNDGDKYGEGKGCLGTDCDDNDSNIHPNAPEVCDGKDNNCVNGIDEDEIVVFPDPNLEKVIREAIDKPSGDIINNDLCGVTELDAHYLEISDLSGIEYCISLSYLYLGSNQINDISQLSRLIHLTDLSLYSNQISDISPLSELTKLTKLSLGDNQINDIFPLSGLTNLTMLYLFWNKINNISPISELTGLTTLYLNINQINDISSLIGLTNLSELDFGYNQIRDISPLSGLTDLMHLDIRNNIISNISPLSSLAKLTYLSINSNQISDISPISLLTNLTDLFLGNNKINNISPLSGLTGLIWLFLNYNQVIDISPLSELTNLIWLELEFNQISDISSLSSLADLITGLGLGNNQISDVSQLSGLINLTWLDLKFNQINDIFPLSNLINLNELDLEYNQISDIKPLVDNLGIGRGDEVILTVNPLDYEACTVEIPALRERGVSVSEDTCP